MMNHTLWHTFLETAATDPVASKILKAGEPEQIVALAAKKGFQFSKADVAEAYGELNEKAMAGISGGRQLF